ncbi:MAG: glycosyltransferase [Planctomycetota bacterium]|nr:MAG: glycosyltransferase [Planctomycetota bacterium]
MNVLTIHSPALLMEALGSQPFTSVVALTRGANGTPVTDSASGVIASEPFNARCKLDLVAVRHLRRVIDQWRPDVIHADSSRGLAAAVLATLGMRRRPRIVSQRGVTAFPSLWDPSNWLTLRNPRVDGHGCVSGAVRDVLIRAGAPPERCVVTYRRVAADDTAGADELARLRAELGIPDDAFVVGSIANFRRVKGGDLILKAAASGSDLRDVYWVLIGRVLDRRLQRLAADPAVASRVRLAGFQPQAARLAPLFDVFVMASRCEGMCHAVLEAMFRGVCPVVTAVGGMKEIVRDGRDGRVVPPEDPGALAAAIRELFRDARMRTRLAESARQRAREIADPVRVAERTMRLYRAVLQ